MSQSVERLEVTREQSGPGSFPISALDRAGGIEDPSVSAQDRLAAKLELVMGDPQFAFQVGGTTLDSKLNQLPGQGFLTHEQRDRLREIQTEALRTRYTPEQLAEIDKKLAEPESHPGVVPTSLGFDEHE